MPSRTFDQDLEKIFRRLYNLEQRLSNPSVIGGNVFEEIILDDPDDGSPSVTIDVRPPEMPTGLNITSGSYFDVIFADVTWVPAATGSFSAGYDVEVAKVIGGIRQLQHVHHTLGTNLRVEPLQPLTTYAFRITPVSRIGIKGAPTAWVEHTTGEDSTVPPQVVGVVVARGATSVVVKFTPLTEAQAPDVTNANGLYEIEVDTSSAFNTGNLRTVRTTQFVYAFNDVLSEGSWYARVRAIDSSGNQGPWSATAGPATAGGVIDSMVVSGLDAAKITFGTMHGDRITANTLNVNRIVTSSLTTQTITLAGGALQAGSPPTTGLILNSQGLRLYSGGFVSVALDVGGSATFAGTISSSTITGSTIYVGGGNTVLDANGINLIASSSWDPTRGFRWTSGGSDIARMFTSGFTNLEIQNVTGGGTIRLDGPRIDLQGDSSATIVLNGDGAGATTIGGGTISITSNGVVSISSFSDLQLGQTWESVSFISWDLLFPNGLYSSATGGNIAGYAFLGGANRIYNYTSSKRYKINYRPVEADIPSDLIYDLELVTYDPVQPSDMTKAGKLKKGAEPDGTRGLGVLAEDAADIMLARGVDPNYFVNYDGDGQVMGFAYDRLGILLILEVKKLRDRVATLEKKIKKG